MFGSAFLGVYFLSIAMNLVISLRNRIQSALIITFVIMEMCGRVPVLSF